jgi:hypothetical protein
MPETPQELADKLSRQIQPRARQRLLARGLARGMVWRDGILPDGAPAFGTTLTIDLLDHGYAVLAEALRLRDFGGHDSVVEQSLRVAAECIESAVRKGDGDEERDFHLVVAACAFHLAHFGARAFCLLPSVELRSEGSQPNISSPERALALLMRRALSPLRKWCADALRSGRFTDELLAATLEGNDRDPEQVEADAIIGNFLRGIAQFVSATDRGESLLAAQAEETFRLGTDVSGALGHVSLWWANTLARHLVADLWRNSFYARVPEQLRDVADDGDNARWQQLRVEYIAVLRARQRAEIDLWPSQWVAADRAVDATDDLIVALPTSAGKTRIAELCILRALASGKRAIYVTPLRALSAQVERTLSRTFRSLGVSVTALYGASGVAAADVATMTDANIVVATPEKLDFALRQSPEVIDDVGVIVLDEGHMIGLGQREIRYEVLVQRLLRRADADSRRLICLSAIFDEGEAFDDFTAWLRSDAPGTAVRSSWRPTRQRSGTLLWRGSSGQLELNVEGERPYLRSFVRAEPARGKRKYAFPKDDEELLIATMKAFVADGHRVLIYSPRRGSVEAVAESALRLHRQGYLANLLPRESSIERALRLGEEWLGVNHVALRALKLGIGVHHAALPRPFLAEIEELLNNKALNVVVASPTLAQGLDLSCSVLLLRSIYRFRDEPIPASEFANVMGRAGRAFVDLDGITVLPIFPSGWQREHRLNAFRGLLDQSDRRTIESGLVQLARDLHTLLANTFTLDADALLAYALDAASTWSLAQNSASADDERGPENAGEPEDGEVREQQRVEQRFLSLVDLLDAAILGTVDDLEITTAAVANALDEALRGSLAERRINRLSEGDATLVRAIILGRAQWLWERTTGVQRLGYFAAQVGFETGRFIDDNLTDLVNLLLGAEAALSQGNLENAATLVVRCAALLRNAATFRFEYAIEGWELALGAWIRGESVVEAVPDEELAVAYIQNDVVYRLVWGVEAVRVHAQALGIQDSKLLEGRVGLALTYGIPTPAGALLAKAGLSSRVMIGRLLAVRRADFTDEGGLRAWLNEIAPVVSASGFWEDHATSAMWYDFLARWHGERATRITRVEETLPVKWRDGVGRPDSGSLVTLLHDDESGVTFVYDERFSARGELVVALPMVGSLGVTGTVSADLQSLLVRFAH